MRVQLRATEQIVFTQRLHMLLRSGVPLLTAIRMLGGSAGASAQWRAVLARLSELLSDGVGFAAAVRMSRASADEWVFGLLEAGELSGSLPEHIGFWNQHVRVRLQLKQQLHSALIYPLLVCGLICIQLIILFWFILPRLLPLFALLEYRMPWPTRVLLFAYGQLAAYWGFYLAGGICVVWGVFWAFRVARMPVFLVRMFIRLPIIGPWYHERNVLTISRSLGVLLRSGVPLLSALMVTRRTVHGPEYQRLVMQMITAVEEGKSLASVFVNAVIPIPVEFSDLVSTGEQAGQLAEACMQATEALGDHVHMLTQRMTALAEPALLMIVACGVGFVAVSIVLPLYGITQAIHY